MRSLGCICKVADIKFGLCNRLDLILQNSNDYYYC